MESVSKLYRGQHELPHMSQVLRRDLRERTIRDNFGARQHGVRLSPEQAQASFEGRGPGRSMARPYQFLIYSVGSFGTSDMAFETYDDFTAWMDAYGISFVHGEPPTAGDYFELQLPADDSAFQELIATGD
ncbi:hypothetical protein [Catenulispora rubra]|uniref:hypothetical protein n=1 Tax=Catenulispora rubra TaxID=280293 RepID=UPI00189239B2|nr:hypothetical protein [Catenulispora rubra]